VNFACVHAWSIYIVHCIYLDIIYMWVPLRLDPPPSRLTVLEVGPHPDPLQGNLVPAEAIPFPLPRRASHCVLVSVLRPQARISGAILRSRPTGAMVIREAVKRARSAILRFSCLYLRSVAHRPPRDGLALAGIVIGAAAAEHTGLDADFSSSSREDGPQGRKAGRDDACGHLDARPPYRGRERVGWVAAAVGEEDGEAIG